MEAVALIPAYKPAESLVGLVEGLLAAGFSQVLVVDDGGGAAFAGIFERVRRLPGATVLTHPVNRGKGAALKTGFSYFLEQNIPGPGLITIDADGQHGIEDSVKVAEILRAHPGHLVIGARAFDGAVPLRSRIGNRATRTLFRLLVGVALSDTQSGLRGIPRGLLSSLLTLRSLRYEFELEMLILCKTQGIGILECPIRTIYLDNNSSSHFNPLRDSALIYLSLFRFSLTSIAAAVLDNGIFLVLMGFGWGILPAQILSRFTAAAVNYGMVRHYVFGSRQPISRSLPRFIAAVIGLGTLSYGLILLLTSTLGMPPIWAKLLVETVIYLGNFLIQREIVFRARRP